MAAGCTMTHEWDDHPYAEVRDNGPMQRAFADNAVRVGRSIVWPDAQTAVVGSTDMGNVSHVVPSIHPMLQVAPRGVSIHSAEFTGYAGAEEGDRAVLEGAKAMAMTVVDVWTDPDLLAAARDDFTLDR
jgi:metal-dependent amidase/aminoacylase/carboxypeptidase family protein